MELLFFLGEILNFIFECWLKLVVLSFRADHRTALVRWYSLTERAGRYLREGEERDQVVKAGKRFVVRYVDLAKLAIRQGKGLKMKWFQFFQSFEGGT